MNPDLPSPPNSVGADGRFDTALRACHQEAVAHLSPRVQAQLQQRLHMALAPARTRARHAGWGVAVACSLALVAAFGLHRRAANDVPATSPVPVVAGNSDNGELVATLDEAPDLYLWVASDDANDMLRSTP